MDLGWGKCQRKIYPAILRSLWQDKVWFHQRTPENQWVLLGWLIERWWPQSSSTRNSSPSASTEDDFSSRQSRNPFDQATYSSTSMRPRVGYGRITYSRPQRSGWALQRGSSDPLHPSFCEEILMSNKTLCNGLLQKAQLTWQRWQAFFKFCYVTQSSSFYSRRSGGNVL